ncbi:primosomal protein N' [Serinibacter salmoneus]|uniref:Probable replication restart protein PriA n=1 Tax=Serinibacter salmoneus TaxID=556530 RepID=A0A2A9D123_9MICO|nr:primosomal protein N' [Serinibacter salmoneus]PFG19652.1 replication restart DNA helicase PriA [Serinibacter salmoneus]
MTQEAGGERAGTPPLVAEVCVDLPLAHLDRPFDYRIPEHLDGADSPADVGVGTRVKVTFSGRQRDGWVLAVRAATPQDEVRALAPLKRLVSPVVALTPEIAALARRVADRYAGTLSDVLRLAVPPRHARAEAGVLTALSKVERPEPGEPSPALVGGPGAPVGGPDAPADLGPWRDVPGGEALLRRIADRQAPRAVWTLTGGPATFRDALVHAARVTLSSGRGVLVVVPDVADVDRVASHLDEALAAEVVRLVASDGPSVRARAHLRLATGLARVVVGTRSAVWAPVQHLGLAVCWDDGDDSLVEQRSPYPHAGQVLALRSEGEGAALLLASPARSVWAQHLVATGWAASLRAQRAWVRERAPRVMAPDAEDLGRSGPGEHARIPTPAWRALAEGLEHGPVLVSTPRSGYVPHLVCARCREVARCSQCEGVLAFPSARGAPVCTACGHAEAGWRCSQCGGVRLRAARIGTLRTAEELGRAFPQVPVLASEAGSIASDVDETPRIVVATPGAEPEAAGGYAAAVLLDAALATSLPGLGGGEEAMRRWMHTTSLVRSARDGGRVVVVGGGEPTLVQALVRADPVGFAERELAERAELRFPPAVRMATVTGTIDAVEDLLAEFEAPEGGEVIPPRPAPAGAMTASLDEGQDGEDGEVVRALVRAPLAQGVALAVALRAARAVRSAHKRRGAVRIVLDPREL